MATQLSFTVTLEPQEEGGYTALVPALPEVVSEGETEEEALERVAEAIRMVLAYRREQGLPIPADVAPTVRKITVAAA